MTLSNSTPDSAQRQHSDTDFLMLGTPRYAGGVQAVVNPVAIR